MAAEGEPTTMNSLVSVNLSVHSSATNRCKLMVVFTNITDGSLRIFRNDLPWESRHSVMLIAVRAGAGNAILSEDLPVDDPIIGDVQIIKNQKLQGTIDLEQRFPDLIHTLEKADVILFWSYQLTPIEKSSLPRQGGWLLIPKLHQ